MVGVLSCLARLAYWISQMGLLDLLCPLVCLVMTVQPVAATRLALLLLWDGGFVDEVLPCLCQGWPQLFCYLLWKENHISTGTPFSRQLKKVMLAFHPSLCVL